MTKGTVVVKEKSKHKRKHCQTGCRFATSATDGLVSGRLSGRPCELLCLWGRERKENLPASHWPKFNPRGLNFPALLGGVTGSGCSLRAAGSHCCMKGFSVCCSGRGSDSSWVL